MKILLPLSFILLVFCCSTNGKSGNAAESQNVSSKPFYLMSTDELISLGQKYRNEGNFAESMRVLYFASNMTTENPKTHFERGKTYLEYAASVRDYNYFNAASQEFQRALLNDKDNEAECESLIGLAECQASMLFMVPNMQQTGEGVQHFVRAAQLKPNDLEIQKKLLCLNIISGQFSLTETMLKELAGKLDGDPVYHELAATNFAIQAARNKPAEPEEFEEAFEHLLRAVELSLNESKKEKPATKGDIFFELVQGYSSPMTKLRELVAPDDLPKYVKHVRELKTKNRELYRMIARARLMRPFNNQYDKQPFEMRYMLFGDDPVFCLEYAFSHDFRNTQGHDIAKILTEKMIKDGRFVITGRFYRGDATCWLGVGTNQKELFEQSIPDFEATVKAVPNWDYACLKLGWAYLHSQQFDKAQVTFLQGIAINPDSIPLRTALLDTQLRKSSSGRIDPEMAASLAEWGMRHNRNDFASRCQVLLRSKELLKFETAPGAMSPSEIAKEAQNLVAEKKTEQAVNRYLRLAEHDPNPDTSLTGYYLYENLGTLYYQQKNWEKTVETLACTIKIESPIYDQPPYPIEMMFEALHHLKKHDDIVGLYKIIVAGTPDYFAQGRKSLYYVGYAMNETRRNPKEIFKVVQPMINDPTLHLVDDMALWKFVADMAKRAGENEVFVAIQERHIQQDPFSIGDFHLQEKNYDQAVASYEYALDYNETIQDKKEIRRKIATVLLGSIAEQPGAAENPARAEKAVEHLKQLVFDEPENRDFWEMLLRAAKIAPPKDAKKLGRILSPNIFYANKSDYDELVAFQFELNLLLKNCEGLMKDLEILAKRGELPGELFAMTANLNRITELDPVFYEVLQFLADKNFEPALEKITEHPYPDTEPVLKTLSLMLAIDLCLATDKPEQAVQIFRNFENAKPNVQLPKETYLVTFGNCLLKTNDPLNAGKLFSAVIKENDKSYQAYLGRYRACLKMMQTEKIANDHEKKNTFLKRALADLDILKFSDKPIRDFPPWPKKEIRVDEITQQ